MRKFIIISLLSILSLNAFASDWKELQSREIPKGTPVYYSQTDSGKLKYCIYIQGRSVNVSETNAKEFVAGRRRLELVKWYNIKTCSYKLTVRELKNQNIDLNTLWQRQETSPFVAP